MGWLWRLQFFINKIYIRLMDSSSQKDLEVFDNIADLITKDTFSSAITEFMKENC